MKKNSLRKNFIWNLVGTTFNAFNSLFYMIIVTRINGIKNAGIFSIAFATACILYIIGIYAGRIYQVTENDKKITDKDYIISRVISCLLMLIIGLLFIFIRGYNFYKSIIFILLILYKLLESFSEVLYAIMQKNNLLYKVGISLFLKSIFSLLLFLITDLITNNLYISCISILIVNILFIIFYDFIVLNKIEYERFKYSKESIIKIYTNGFFTFAIAFLGLYITNVSKYIIDILLTEDIQAIFAIIIMPATIVSLLAQFLIHPILNDIFELYKLKKFKEFKQMLCKIILSLFTCGLLCSIIGYFLGIPILEIIYGINLKKYSIHLFFVILSATFYTMAGIISPFLITMRYTKVQFVYNLICVILQTILTYILVLKCGFNGAIISYCIVMILYFIFFYFIAIKIINKVEKQERIEVK